MYVYWHAQHTGRRTDSPYRKDESMGKDTRQA